MQLPPDDELVLVAGAPPIRAKKLRYFEDENFVERRLAPPNATDCARRPAKRPDDWAECHAGQFQPQFAALTDVARFDDEGGLARHPTIEASQPSIEGSDDGPEHLPDDDIDPADGQRLRDLSRAADNARRAHAMDQADDDLLPGL